MLGGSSFNSKLVRLKVTSDADTSTSSAKFQFQTGAIKRSPLTGKAKAKTGFNSKLVRLKVNEFVNAISRLFTVSIPNWCD